MTLKTAVRVDVREGFEMERALKRFKRLTESYGVVREYRKRQEFKPPSEVKREKHEAAAKRRRKAQLKNRKSSRL